MPKRRRVSGSIARKVSKRRVEEDQFAQANDQRAQTNDQRAQTNVQHACTNDQLEEQQRRQILTRHQLKLLTERSAGPVTRSATKKKASSHVRKELRSKRRAARRAAVKELLERDADANANAVQYHGTRSRSSTANRGTRTSATQHRHHDTSGHDPRNTHHNARSTHHNARSTHHDPHTHSTRPTQHTTTRPTTRSSPTHKYDTRTRSHTKKERLEHHRNHHHSAAAPRPSGRRVMDLSKKRLHAGGLGPSEFQDSNSHPSSDEGSHTKPRRKVLDDTAQAVATRHRARQIRLRRQTQSDEDHMAVEQNCAPVQHGRQRNSRRTRHREHGGAPNHHQSSVDARNHHQPNVDAQTHQQTPADTQNHHSRTRNSHKPNTHGLRTHSHGGDDPRGPNQQPSNAHMEATRTSLETTTYRSLPKPESKETASVAQYQHTHESELFHECATWAEQKLASQDDPFRAYLAYQSHQLSIGKKNNIINYQDFLRIFATARGVKADVDDVFANSTDQENDVAGPQGNSMYADAMKQSSLDVKQSSLDVKQPPLRAVLGELKTETAVLGERKPAVSSGTAKRNVLDIISQEAYLKGAVKHMDGQPHSSCSKSTLSSSSTSSTKNSPAPIKIRTSHLPGVHYLDYKGVTGVGAGVLHFMARQEQFRRPRHQYLSTQTHITKRMRAILFDWMIEVSQEFCLKRSTAHTSFYFVDRYLTKTSFLCRSKLQLVGVTALWLAAKVEEVLPPKVAVFAAATDGAYTTTEILKLEKDMINVFEWQLSPITAYTWLHWFVHKWHLEDQAALETRTRPTATESRISPLVKKPMSWNTTTKGKSDSFDEVVHQAGDFTDQRTQEDASSNRKPLEGTLQQMDTITPIRTNPSDVPEPLFPETLPHRAWTDPADLPPEKAQVLYQAARSLDLAMMDIDALTFLPSLVAATAFVVHCKAVANIPVARIRPLVMYSLLDMRQCMFWMEFALDTEVPPRPHPKETELLREGIPAHDLVGMQTHDPTSVEIFKQTNGRYKAQHPACKEFLSATEPASCEPVPVDEPIEVSAEELWRNNDTVDGSCLEAHEQLDNCF